MFHMKYKTLQKNGLYILTINDKEVAQTTSLLALEGVIRLMGLKLHDIYPQG